MFTIHEIHVTHFCALRNCLILAVAAANADLATADSLALAREAQNFHVAGDPGFCSMEKLWKIDEDKG